MDDIVERLRAAAHSGDLALGQSFDCMAVANEIEQLRTEVARLTRLYKTMRNKCNFAHN